MKIVSVIIALIVLGLVFGAYPKTMDFNEFKTVYIEKRTFDCIKNKSGSYECPVLKLETGAKELSEALNIVWCPFVPLSYEGVPSFKLLFKSFQDRSFELGIRGNELSNYCLLPQEAREYLEKITNSKSAELTYEKL